MINEINNKLCDLLGCQYNEDGYCIYATAKIKLPFDTMCVANAMMNFEEE